MRKSKFSYQWVIVGCCFLMIFAALGFGSTPRKLYMVAVPKALGLDYGPYSFTDTFRYVSTAIINFFFGALIVRFGPRKLIGSGFVLLALSSLVYSCAEGLPGVYLGGALLGAGLTMTSTTMSSYVINLWCKEHKGTITGLVLCANGLGGALAMQVLSPIISQSAFGYRNAYRLVALIMLTVGALIVMFFRDTPADGKLAAPGKKQAKTSWEGVTVRQALRRPYFYASAVCVFLTGMVLQSIVGSDANHLAHAGLDSAFIASVLSINALVLSGSKFLVGVLYDRVGLKKTLLICNFAALTTLGLLILATYPATGRAAAIGYSVLSALALPLETIMIPLLTAELYGQRSFAQMLGVVSAINTLGFSFGPPITNFIFDAIGSYTPVFWGYLGVMTLVTLISLYTINAAARSRKATEEAA